MKSPELHLPRFYGELRTAKLSNSKQTTESGGTCKRERKDYKIPDKNWKITSWKQTKKLGNMKITNSVDIYEDSGLKDLIYELDLKKYFETKDYGNNGIALFFVINCLKFNVKNRIRFSNKDKVLYWDVILDYDTIKSASPEAKKNILANSIIKSFDILDKYKKLNLNKFALKDDAQKYFTELGWLSANSPT